MQPSLSHTVSCVATIPWTESVDHCQIHIDTVFSDQCPHAAGVPCWRIAKLICRDRVSLGVACKPRLRLNHQFCAIVYQGLSAPFRAVVLHVAASITREMQYGSLIYPSLFVVPAHVDAVECLPKGYKQIVPGLQLSGKISLTGA